ncbi:MAG: fasciclin domain-containing protein [Actinomycetota bacterium]
MRKPLAAFVAAATLATAPAIPAIADDEPESPGNIVEIVIDVSGDAGFDKRGRDYDILREALIATDLAGAVATTQDITVFAPKDRAFIRLARDLGYHGHDEAGAFAFIAEATGFKSAAEPGLLAQVLLYHVAPGLIFSGDLADGPVTTLQGGTFTPKGNRLIDNDLNSRDPRVKKPFDLVASNGVIHTINRVLRPIDLPPEIPATVVDVVLDASGDSGFDWKWRDYDILREALVATDLVGAVASFDDITVFAPNDFAFLRLAWDLGYRGWSESGAFAFIAEATGYVSAAEPGLLASVLLYHVADDGRTVHELQGEVVTMFGGATVTVDGQQPDPGSPRQFTVEAGSYTVRAMADGHRAAESAVVVTGGETTAVGLTLEAETSVWREPWLWTVGAIVVAGAVVGVGAAALSSRTDCVCVITANQMTCPPCP